MLHLHSQLLSLTAVMTLLYILPIVHTRILTLHPSFPASLLIAYATPKLDNSPCSIFCAPPTTYPAFHLTFKAVPLPLSTPSTLITCVIPARCDGPRLRPVWGSSFSEYPCRQKVLARSARLGKWGEMEYGPS